MSFFRETCFLLHDYDGCLFSVCQGSSSCGEWVVGGMWIHDFRLSVMVEFTWRGSWFESELKLDGSDILSTSTRSRNIAPRICLQIISIVLLHTLFSREGHGLSTQEIDQASPNPTKSFLVSSPRMSQLSYLESPSLPPTYVFALFEVPQLLLERNCIKCILLSQPKSTMSWDSKHCGLYFVSVYLRLQYNTTITLHRGMRYIKTSNPHHFFSDGNSMQIELLDPATQVSINQRSR
jgi:hypothetical protein